jgi:hypothetical protein
MMVETSSPESRVLSSAVVSKAALMLLMKVISFPCILDILLTRNDINQVLNQSHSPISKCFSKQLKTRIQRQIITS